MKGELAYRGLLEKWHFKQCLRVHAWILLVGRRKCHLLVKSRAVERLIFLIARLVILITH